MTSQTLRQQYDAIVEEMAALNTRMHTNGSVLDPHRTESIQRQYARMQAQMQALQAKARDVYNDLEAAQAQERAAASQATAVTAMAAITDTDALSAAYTRLYEVYERTAPLVARWADEQVMLLNSDAWQTLTLGDMITARRVLDAGDGQPMGAALAINTVYKLLDRQGKDTTGWY